MKFYLFLILIGVSFVSRAQNTSFISQRSKFHLKKIVTNLEIPWSFVFLPSGDLLITERDGQIVWHKRLSPPSEFIKMRAPVPVTSRGQGGLMDIALHPQFKTNKWIYFTHTVSKKKKYTTEISRAQWAHGKFKKVEKLYTAEPYYSTSHHFGSRIAFDQKGHVFFSVGDRGNRDLAQSLKTDNGKVLRLNEDGSIPKDNPFSRKGKPSPLWSFGSRNIQGMVYTGGQLWTHEHGPRGGDEINLIVKGQNYGWPIVTYGKEYIGGKIGKGLTTKKGMVDPLKYYRPSIAPTGMVFYKGDKYPKWKNSFFIGSLVLRHLNRVSADFKKEERLLQFLSSRIRNVALSPDGYLYVSTDQGDIFKIIPDFIKKP